LSAQATRHALAIIPKSKSCLPNSVRNFHIREVAKLGSNIAFRILREVASCFQPNRQSAPFFVFAISQKNRHPQPVRTPASRTERTCVCAQFASVKSDANSPQKKIEDQNPSDASPFPPAKKQTNKTMSTAPINLSPSYSGHDVPSRHGVDGPLRYFDPEPIAPPSSPKKTVRLKIVFIVSPDPVDRVKNPCFRFLTEFNAFNGFIFSAKPKSTRPFESFCSHLSVNPSLPSSPETQPIVPPPAETISPPSHLVSAYPLANQPRLTSSHLLCFKNPSSPRKNHMTSTMKTQLVRTVGYCTAAAQGQKDTPNRDDHQSKTTNRGPKVLGRADSIPPDAQGHHAGTTCCRCGGFAMAASPDRKQCRCPKAGGNHRD